MTVESAQTKDGRTINFSLEVDSEGDNNRGWQVDKITATIDGEEAGYIKLSYIPKARFENYYPTIFNYAEQMGGWCCIPTADLNPIDDNHAYRMSKTVHYKELSTEGLRSMLNRCYLHLHRREKDAELKDMDRKQLLVETVALEEHLHKHESMGLQYRKFKARWLNKPIDDYIRTHKEFSRQNVALSLYVVAEQYCRSKKLKMHLSKCRTPGSGSTELAQKLRDLGMTKKMSNGREQLQEAA